MAYVDARSRVLGADHPLTLGAMSALSAILRSTGDLARAIDLGEPAVTGLKRVVGLGHPLTTQAFTNLVGTLAKAPDPSAVRAVIARVTPNGAHIIQIGINARTMHPIIAKTFSLT
jgi:hypothetical protein